MKTFILIFTFSFCFQGLFAQYDTIYPIVSGNKVDIHWDYVSANCAFGPSLDYTTINDSIIKWYLLDTTAIFFGCTCWFNYLATIDSLNPGNYHVFIYSGYAAQTYTDSGLVGTTSFTITEQNIFSSTRSTFQNSPCYDYTSLQNHSNIDEQFIIENNTDGLMILSKGSKRIDNVELYNLSGQLVFRKKYNSSLEILITTSTLEKGFYVISLLDNKGIKSNFKVTIF